MSSESDPLLPREKKSRTATSTYALYAVGVLSVFLVAGVGWHFYCNTNTNVNSLRAWEERSARWAGKQVCTSCAVVIPHPILKGKGFGPAIDAHDCVVRFNAHDPDEAPAEDWGTKDDIRVINGDGGIRQVLEGEANKHLSCFDHENPTCRRIMLTWDSPDIQGFMNDHPIAEMMSPATYEYVTQLPGCENGCNNLEMLQQYAQSKGLPVPQYPSTNFNTVFSFRHPLMCGDKLTVYGIPANEADDSEGYIDNHGPAYEGHEYLSEHKYLLEAAGSPGWEMVHIQEM